MIRSRIFWFAVGASLSLVISAFYFRHMGTEGPKPALAEKKALYTCPMHPSVTADHPDNCPICHMALQRVDDDAVEVEEDTALVNGRSAFSLSRERQQLIGVTKAVVGKRRLESEVRASGKVAFDPDLFAAVEEYRQALVSTQAASGSSYAALREQSNELVRASRTKLRLMGLTDPQIRTLSSAGRSGSMNLLLPSGIVWIYAEIFEYEVPGIKIGQKIEAVAPSVPGKVFSGKISSISPVLNNPTRTLRVRAEVMDPSGVLRPDTFVNVKIRLEMGEKLSVPEDSVLHSGDRSFVFIMRDKGRFEPRAISVGRKTSEYFEVLSGLEEGETVVTGANFLIDSESRLRAALQHMSEPNTNPSSSPGDTGSTPERNQTKK